MNLIIVESPVKSRTLQGFLGPQYKVLSSFGHIRDLPKNDLGIDIEKDFKPKYVIPLKSRKIISELEKETEKTDKIILGTDEDREGEAIAWHLQEALKLKNPQRIVFHEITKSAIEQALKAPRDINISLVDAQQARRILDRIVGYKLSPFLWKKVARNLSAGRVQSAAVRLIVEKEREIEKFKPEEYWSIEAELQKILNPKTETLNKSIPSEAGQNSNDQNKFTAVLTKKDNKSIPKLGIKIKKDADDIIKDLENAEYKVSDIEKKEIKKNPFPPFTTSTLQQEAWRRFRFPSKLTMQIAQQLYERGHISYHRTDSVNLSQMSLASAKKFIEETFGKNYWPGYFRKYKVKGRTQEAHEAIRPTYANQTPDDLKTKAKFDNKQYRLYDLIWRRFIACQMKEAIFDSTAVEIKAGKYTFKATGQVQKFDGFLKVYPIKFQENELPLLEKKEILNLIKLNSEQHFTQPPARYTEASLIKTLEENGIGRPSTYAPIISTIQDRNYIEKNEQKKFIPTEIGTVVNDLLVEHFPKIVDIKFTAKMENELDEVAEGKEKWTDVCKDFYSPFQKNLDEKYKEVKKKDVAVEETDKKCPKCDKPLLIRLGKYGKFYACSGFPKCRHTEPLEKDTLNIKCPQCEKGKLVEKRTKKGKIFFGCDQFPECDFALWDKPVINKNNEIEKCPKCNSALIEKNKKIRCSNRDCPVENFDKK